MSPIIVTRVQAAGRVPAVVAVGTVAPVLPQVTAIPAARQPSPAGAYFQLFKTCSCGHSSAWHSGSFGEAWRAGEQVQGGCEAADELSSASCPCRGFKPAERAS